MNRRRFVTTAAAAFGTGLAVACDLPTPTQLEPSFAKGGNGGGKGGGKGDGGSRNALNIPSAGPPPASLTVAPTDVDLGGGRMSRVWTYNGQFPAPTIEVTEGDDVALTLYNGLDDETITHWHGMLVDTENDGHPRKAFPPGGFKDYGFKVQQRATMNWYHPHPHEKTGEQVAMGLAGAFIIRDAHEAKTLDLPSGSYEVPLIIRDASFDRAGDMVYKPRSGGFLGKVPLVNGTIDPVLDVDRGLYRFRILNGCNARLLDLALSDGSPFILIGNDGGFLDQTHALSDMLISPGERLDVLVDLSGLPQNESIMLVDRNSGWDLLELKSSGVSVDTGSVPGSLPAITPLANPVRERDFSFDGMSRINGQEYDMADDGFQVALGDVERWRFTTNGNAPHPVHIHGAYFQVESRTGGRGDTFPWESGWKDTVLLEDGETVEVLIQFTAHAGLYLMHCHKLEHEDMGMMLNFTVVDPAVA